MSEELTEIKIEIQRTNLLLKKVIGYGKVIFFTLALLSFLQFCSV